MEKNFSSETSHSRDEDLEVYRTIRLSEPVRLRGKDAGLLTRQRERHQTVAHFGGWEETRGNRDGFLSKQF